MPDTTTPKPEDVVLSILARLEKVRFSDDRRLARIFHKASKAKENSIFAPFEWHPLYYYSKRLSDILLEFDMSGSIKRENASAHYYTATPHTQGPYGKAKYDSLSTTQQAEIDSVVDEITNTFRSQINNE